jgi:hypothetical protein
VAVGLAALVVAVVQLRTGVIPMLDTATYWSGTRAVADGHPFTTTLAPSFTNFSAAEFLERGGRLPFVDFPVGYPTLAGVLAVALGAEWAMGVVTAVAVVAIGVLTVLGTGPTTPAAAGWRAVVAVGLVALPTSRLVTQAALSEPLFIATALGLLAALLRYRRTGSGWAGVVALTMAAGLLRFVGAPLAALTGLERYRRTGRPLAALGWTGLGMLPAFVNIAWASAQGGGHSAGWRGLHRDDAELLVRSVGGWLDARQGDLRRTYFTLDGAAWWSWPLAIGWLVAIGWAIAGLVHLTRRRLPEPLELCLAAAGILTAGLVAGMLGFDALVIADNRLMLPAGLITIVGLVWSIDVPAPAAGRWPTAIVPWVAVAVWLVAAVHPQDLTERFSDLTGPPRYVAAAAASGADIVIVNDADGVHWHTGLPAAYAPLPVKALTGEAVDVAAAYRALPCPMWEHGGVLIIADDALFGSSGSETLDELVAEGHLTSEPVAGGVRYRPTATACAG